MHEEAEYFYKKGINAIQNQNQDAGEFFLLKAAEIEECEKTYSSLGWFYGTILQEMKKGLRFFRMAILQNPHNGDLYNDYGALLLKTGRLKASLCWFLRAIRLPQGEKKHFSFYNIALIYQSWKEPERSLHYLHLAMEEQPEFKEALQLYFSILKNVGQHQSIKSD